MSTTTMIDNPYAVTAREAAEAVGTSMKALLNGIAYIPTMLWGDPGVGKTQAIEAVARFLGWKLTVIQAVDREPSELVGVYWVINGELKRLSPEDLPLGDEPHILFFDELPQAPMMNKNVIGRLVHERRAGNVTLGKNTYVVCAGNYAHNRAGTTPMPGQLNLRMSHLDVIVSFEQWLTWAASSDLHPYVNGYIKVQPNHLHLPDPALRASPNPRSWGRVSDIEFAGFTGQARKAMIVGTLGVDVGTAYMDRIDSLKGLPDPVEVLKNPLTAPIPQDRATLFVLCSALGKVVKPATMGALLKYTNRFTNDEEYQAFCITEAKLRNKAVESSRDYKDFLLTPRGQSLAA